MKGFIPKFRTGKKELNSKIKRSFIEIGMVNDTYKKLFDKDKAHLVKGGEK